MTIKQKLNKRITQGIKWLDKEVGRKKWLRKIKTGLLKMINTNVCVCGQVFGGFMNVVGVGYQKKSYTWAISKGFIIGDNPAEEYDLLTKLWVARIKKLKAKK